MELKPCPFCGGKGKVSYKDYRFGGWNGKSDSRRKYRVQVICNRCRARGKPIITDWIVNYSPYNPREEAQKAFAPYVERAAEAWNRRADDDGFVHFIHPGKVGQL
jgi:hypothetical protein